MTNDGKRPKPEDSIAILSRRDFLIASALVGTGVGLGACEDKPKPHGDDVDQAQPCLKVRPEEDVAEQAQPCLKVRPEEDVAEQAQPCLKVRPEEDVVEQAQPCLKIRPDGDVVEPEICLSVSREELDVADTNVRCLSTILPPAEVDLDAIDGLDADALAAPHPCLSRPPSPLDEPTVCLSVARPKKPTHRSN